MDASLLVAVGGIWGGVGRWEGEGEVDGGGDEGEFGKKDGDGDGDGGDWVGEVVRVLDMALLMAGGVGRETMIEELLRGLERVVGGGGGGAVGDGEDEGEGEEKEEEGWTSDPQPHRPKRRKLHNPPIPNSFPPSPFSFPPHPKVNHPIPHTPLPSLLAFEAHTHDQGTPLVITNAIADWPALRRWRRPGYLLSRTFGGRRLVPVEVGRSYTDAGWGQRIVTFGEFLRGGMVMRGGDSVEGGGAGEEGAIGYLAQHDLFAQIPALRADIRVPDYCYTNPPSPPPSTPLLASPLLNAWFGPADTVSPLHTDPYHNLLCQVVGTKYVRLYAPDQGPAMYPRGIEAGGVNMGNTSEVDVEGDEVRMRDRFPRFMEARYVETVLGEGECLYIPVGWWHYVRSLEVSFSVSFWWN